MEVALNDIMKCADNSDLVPLDVSWGTGEKLDGACEGDGGARLDKHRRFSVNHSCCRWKRK